MADATLAKALVLQGGGALSAYELGAARVLYAERGFAPDLIAGFSMGAITAVLLARPKGGDPLAALEGFWRHATLPTPWFPDPLKSYVSMWANPHLFTPRIDVWNLAAWTGLYSAEPLRQALADYVDKTALADPDAMPRLILTATDLAGGEIAPFWSADGGLSLDHVLASSSLPPHFPATRLGEGLFWDGGLFDSTPLGEVLDRMKASPAPAEERELVIVSHFPNAGELPTSFADVSQRMLSLSFANKTASDLNLLKRFNALAALMTEIRSNEAWRDLRAHKAYEALDEGYIEVPRIIAITRSDRLEGPAWTDFSQEGVARLAAAGEAAAREAFATAEGLAHEDWPERLATTA